MPHFKGTIMTDLPPAIFWQEDGEQSVEENDHGDRLVLKINYHLRNYDLTKDHKFRNVNMVLKDSIRAGHQLILKVLDEKDQPIPCRYQLDMYKKLGESPRAEQEIELCSTNGF